MVPEFDPWPPAGVGVAERKHKKCFGSNSGTIQSCGYSPCVSRNVIHGSCPSPSPDNNTEADLRTNSTISLDSDRTHRPNWGITVGVAIYYEFSK
jgi:hypothetical protein